MLLLELTPTETLLHGNSQKEKYVAGGVHEIVSPRAIYFLLWRVKY